MNGGAELSGMPSALYYTWDEEKGETDVAAAIPVKDFVEDADVEKTDVPGGLCLLIDYFGPYDESGEAHGL